MGQYGRRRPMPYGRSRIRYSRLGLDASPAGPLLVREGDGWLAEASQPVCAHAHTTPFLCETQELSNTVIVSHTTGGAIYHGAQTI